VVDNDMLSLPPGGLPALEATVSHEFFHAVQLAYDIGDDAWFMEGTATWIEDEVFDDVNQSLDYLSVSQLRDPDVPLDFSDLQYLYVYGSWIWFQFLTESVGDGGSAPAIHREAGEYADGSALGPDQYSLKALASAIANRDSRLRWAYADFGAWNDAPSYTYSEGDSYPIPPLAKKHSITASRSVQGGRLVMDHLTQGYVAFFPRRGVSSRAKLLVAVDLPPYRTGPEASVLTFSTAGALKYYIIELNGRGDGSLEVPFGRGKIAEVDLVLTNASTRTTCWQDQSSTYSCAGIPKDDGMPYVYGAALLQ
jgi:hypothetical protein